MFYISFSNVIQPRFIFLLLYPTSFFFFRIIPLQYPTTIYFYFSTFSNHVLHLFLLRLITTLYLSFSSVIQQSFIKLLSYHVLSFFNVFQQCYTSLSPTLLNHVFSPFFPPFLHGIFFLFSNIINYIFFSYIIQQSLFYVRFLTMFYISFSYVMPPRFISFSLTLFNLILFVQEFHLTRPAPSISTLSVRHALVCFHPHRSASKSFDLFKKNSRLNVWLSV